MSTTRRSILTSAIIVSVLFTVSRLLGFVRRAVFGYYFGAATLQADAYAIVMPISDLVFQVIAGGAVGSAFIPTFAAYFADEECPDEARAWHLFAAVLNLIVLLTTIVAGAVAIFAPQVIELLFAERMAANPDLLEISVQLLRVMLISTVIFGASGVVMAALNARHHFTMPALAAVIYNVGIIIGTIVFAPNVIGVGIGAVVGSLGHLVVQVPDLRRVGAVYRPILTLTDRAVQEVLRLMAPRVLGLSFSYLNWLVMPFIAQTMVDGSLAALSFGLAVMLMPQSALGQALGVVSFPTFATLAANNKFAEMRSILSNTLRLITFLGLPITIGLILLRQPLIAFAFQRGNFTERDTELVAWALLWFAFALVALAMIEVVARAFYALKDTLTPVLIGGLQLAMMFGFGYWFGRIIFPAQGWLGLGGVALGFSIANWIEIVLLLWLLHGKMGGIGGTHLWNGVSRMAIATAVMGGGVWILVSATASLPALLQLIIGTGGGVLVYFGVCHLLKLDEVGRFLAPFSRRIG